MKELKKENTDLLEQLFGDNRGEWASEHFKDLFVSPTYLQKLESLRPCFLVGGRGTGKTTSLQSLRYDSTYERLQSDGLGFDDQEYFGILIRVNKNRVRAFQGNGISEEGWGKPFAHYFNLLSCLELTNLAMWLESKQEININQDSIHHICIELGIDVCNSLEVLKKSIKIAISKLQLHVNNPKSDIDLNFSIPEAPIKTFSEIINENLITEKRIIFCCIDEYENLLDYQQAILNTYIKHAEPPLSYKVGVRKNGFRNKSTLDTQDPLKTPDDYAEIEIADEGFEFFAKSVAELRLRYAVEKDVSVPTSLDDFLEDLPFHKEAIKLGADKISKRVLDELENEDKKLFEFFSEKPASEVYFLEYWKESNEGTLLDLANHWFSNEDEWKTRIGNHGYASLFWISKGNKGIRVRKHYCGSRTLLNLSGGNIRYFLEIIDGAINYQLNENTNNSPKLIISPESQTYAVRDVGERRLNQLEGLADQGVQLKRLVLAIGKVFFELARTPQGKTPEVTLFVINGTTQDMNKIQSLLAEGVGHLAFEVFPRTKATSNFEIRDNEYRLHRIFCGFFEISHRKKRRTTFDAKYLLSVLEDKPGKAISSLLDDREQSDEEDLPEQLAFFGSFYNDGDN